MFINRQKMNKAQPTLVLIKPAAEKIAYRQHFDPLSETKLR
jgi:hypothetical protein